MSYIKLTIIFYHNKKVGFYMKYTTEDELMKVASSAIGKKFGDIDTKGRVDIRTKGLMGHIIEESLFDYKINSTPGADFEYLGIELKVTPVKINKNKTISAKERLVLNIINYMTEVNKSFYTSSFWQKNKKLLLFFYLWEKDLEVKDYKILNSFLHTFTQEDLEIIKDDWKIIHTKLINGLAHEISEGDTMYLGACTKGANAKTVRPQPFSDIPAKQRAYSLKQSYMTSLARDRLNSKELIKLSSVNELKEKSFNEILEEKFSPYHGKTLNEIAKVLDISINKKFKAKVQQVVSAILGIKGTSLSNIDEFVKANIQFKTIRLEPNGMPKEHMSFRQINFNDWLERPFEESVIYNKFETTKFLFVVFEFKDNPSKKERELFFKGIKLWNMPEKTILSEVKDMWEEVHQILEDGVDLNTVEWGGKYRVQNNFPGQDFNKVVHIRPKARDGEDKVRLPDGQYITKQTFWLDRRYIAEVIKDI